MENQDDFKLLITGTSNMTSSFLRQGSTLSATLVPLNVKIRGIYGSETSKTLLTRLLGGNLLGSLY